MDSNAHFQHLYESLVFEDIQNCDNSASSSLAAQTQRKIIAQLYYSAADKRM